ncbi:hypothetical protein C8J57DRAFT_1218500 [Mycena rebaudengoi]|nr:hypothetical protein C8J57DRAFT_1218500 [Mycena rebaudengoi]
MGNAQKMHTTRKRKIFRKRRGTEDVAFVSREKIGGMQGFYTRGDTNIRVSSPAAQYGSGACEQNGERLYHCCEMVRAEIKLHKEILERNRNGDTTKGDGTKYMQPDSRHLVKRTDNLMSMRTLGWGMHYIDYTMGGPAKNNSWLKPTNERKYPSLSNAIEMFYITGSPKTQQTPRALHPPSVSNFLVLLPFAPTKYEIVAVEPERRQAGVPFYKLYAPHKLLLDACESPQVLEEWGQQDTLSRGFDLGFLRKKYVTSLADSVRTKIEMSLKERAGYALAFAVGQGEFFERVWRERAEDLEPELVHLETPFGLIDACRTTRLSSFPHHLCLSFFRTCVAGYAQARLRSLSLSWGFGCPFFVKTARRSIFFKTKMKAEKNLKFCYSNIQTSNFKVQASNSYSKPAPNSKFFKIQDSDFSYSSFLCRSIVRDKQRSNNHINTTFGDIRLYGSTALRLYHSMMIYHRGGHGYGLYGSMGRYVVLCGSVLFSRCRGLLWRAHGVHPNNW